jgi:hypothetical protein
VRGEYRCGREDNIKVDVKNIGFEVDWIHLAQDVVQLVTVNCRRP